jgi:hypothetical protein
MSSVFGISESYAADHPRRPPPASTALADFNEIRVRCSLYAFQCRFSKPQVDVVSTTNKQQL